MDWQKYAAIAACVAVLAGGTVAFFKYHAQFAIAEEVQQVTVDFKYYVLTNQSAQIQQRMWQIEDRVGCDVTKMPQTVREEYRRLELEKKNIDAEIQTLETKRAK